MQGLSRLKNLLRNITMQKINYQHRLDELIEKIKNEDKKPTLLLHSCCAPCSSYCLLYLAKYFNIIDYYYNPNISPKEENDKRSAELKRLIDAYESDYGYKIRFVEGEYEPQKFYEAVKGLEDVKEGGERCFICYRLRLEEAARLAKENAADYFTTTLTISPLKNAEKLNEIGEELSTVYGVKHLPSDFKKKDGYRTSVELSKKYGLYRQDYCGCVFSKREAAK